MTLNAFTLNVFVLAALSGVFLLVRHFITRAGCTRLLPALCTLCAAAFTAMLMLNIQYGQEEAYKCDWRALDDPSKVKARCEAVRVAQNMIGLPMPKSDEGDGVLCCDIAFRPYDVACNISTQIVNDYWALSEPTVRYPFRRDRRRCPLRQNIKWIFDSVVGSHPNTPENPYFLRRINNMISYLKSRGCYYPPNKIKVLPGMLLFFQRDHDFAPTHVAIVAKCPSDSLPEVIATSGSYDCNQDGKPDLKVVELPLKYITDRTNLVGVGDVTFAQYPSDHRIAHEYSMNSPCEEASNTSLPVQVK